MREVVMMRCAMVAVAVLSAGALLAGAPAGAAPRDRERPKVAVDTPDGAVLVSAPDPLSDELAAHGAPVTVTGRASDDVSGIKTVRVLYCAGGRQQDGGWTCGGVFAPPVDPIVQGAVTLSCKNARRSCTWRSTVPDTPGSYLVLVTAVDRTGKTRAAAPRQVIVV